MAYNVQKALASGLSEKEIRSYLSSTGRSADEINGIIGKTDQPEPKSGLGLLDVLYTKEANRMPAEGVGGHIKKGLFDILGLASLPARALGAAQGVGAIENQETNVARPTIDYIKSKNIPVLGGLSDIVLSAVGDPMTYAGAGGIRSLIKKAATTSEQAIASKLPSLTVEAKTGFENRIKQPFIDETILKSDAPPKTLKQKLTFKMPEMDRSILHEKLGPSDKPFTYYSKVQRAAVVNPRNPTAMDLASREATDALGIIKKNMDEIGGAKGEILKQHGKKVIDIGDIRSKFNKLVSERLGGKFNEDGKLISASNRGIRDENSITLAEDMNRNLGEWQFLSAQKLDDMASMIRSLADKQKVSQARQINTVAEGIAKEIRRDIKSKLNATLGKEYSTLNEKYAELAQTNKWLNSKLGEIVDNKTGQTRMGASLLKSALQSNSDRGTKAMFERIKGITGKDLIRDAKYAEIAMRATKDPRAYSLLEETAKIPTSIKSLTDVVLGKVSKRFTDYPSIDAIDNYYTKYQLGR